MLLVLIAIAALYWRVPTNLAPVEDRGVIYVMVRGAEGTSIERMKKNMQLVEQRLLPWSLQKASAISTPRPLAVAGS